MRKLRGNTETLRLRTAVRELAESGLGRGAQDSFAQNAHVQSVQCIGEQNANQECSSCGQTLDGPTLTKCNHVYCKDCILYELEINNGSFPCVLCGDKIMKTNNETETEESKEDDSDSLRKKRKNTKNSNCPRIGV